MLGWMPHGAGALSFPGGDSYHGQFSEGEPCGFGSFDSSLGKVLYEGDFEGGQPKKGKASPAALAAWPMLR